MNVLCTPGLLPYHSLNRSFSAAFTTLHVPDHCRAVTNKDNQMKKANAVKSKQIQADYHWWHQAITGRGRASGASILATMPCCMRKTCLRFSTTAKA